MHVPLDDKGKRKKDGDLSSEEKANRESAELRKKNLEEAAKKGKK